MALPAWFARTMQSPCFVKLTTDPEIEQIAALAGAMLKAGVRPEVAVAVIVYGRLCLSTGPGAADVIVIVCAIRATVKDCCTCGAAR